MGEHPCILDLWKRYVDQRLPKKLIRPEHDVIKEAPQGVERTGLYYSVFNETTGQVEYHLLILPENNLPDRTDSFPTHHLRAVSYVRDWLRRNSDFNHEQKLTLCIGFTVEDMNVRFNSCANAHANGENSRTLKDSQKEMIVNFVVAALNRRATTLAKKAAAREAAAQKAAAEAAKAEEEAKRLAKEAAARETVAQKAAEEAARAEEQAKREAEEAAAREAKAQEEAAEAARKLEELRKQEADAARIAEAEALAKAAAEKERLAQEASDEADRIAAEKAEAERLAQEKADAEAKEKEEVASGA